MYLYGIDIKTASNAYLHTDDDIRRGMIASIGAAGAAMPKGVSTGN